MMMIHSWRWKDDSITSMVIQNNETRGEKIRRKTVLLLCGLPGAGKSSLSAQWAAESGDTMAVIEYDHLQDALLIDDNDNKESIDDDASLQAWRQSRQKALESLEGYLTSERVSVILLDDNFFLRSMRKQVLQVCQRFTTESLILYFGVVWIDTPLEICLQRNRDRVRQVPEDVITRMSRRLEPPDPKKATWEQAVVRLDGNQHSTQENMDQLSRFVQDISTLCEPVEAPVDPEMERQRIESERHRTRESVLHRVDQYLRCCVQSVAKVRPRAAGQANKVRKQVFQTIKSSDDGLSYGDMSWVKEAFLEGITTGEGLSWSEAELATFHMELATILQAKFEKQ
jgi:tRNA uridine 5-carbamoylmethylation protein Kti12